MAAWMTSPQHGAWSVASISDDTGLSEQRSSWNWRTAASSNKPKGRNFFNVLLGPCRCRNASGCRVRGRRTRCLVGLSSVPLRAIAGRLKPHWLGGRVAPVRFVVAAAGVMLVAAGLRLYGPRPQSAWAGEITTLLITDPTLTLGQFWQLVL